jgi:NADPH2:quinone reductase
VLIGLMGGASAQLDLGRLLVKRLTLRGSTLRPQPLAVKAALSANLRDIVLPAILDGRLRLTIDRAFDIGEVADAHRYVESNANLGKVVLNMAV